MLKVCIWMNIPSHYQSAFFEALEDREEIDLKVVYFGGVSSVRVAEGWSGEHALKPFESISENPSSPSEQVESVDGWKDRIHVINAYFSAGLIDYFSANGIPWCHWSEMPGIRLAELLGYRMPLFRMLNPLMLAGKRKEGAAIKKHALGALGQGRLARRAFQMMGVPEPMTADLFYAPKGLSPADPCAEILSFAKGRKVFLSVGALCRRKGIDVLIKAFARMDTTEWCLVLCGLDKSDGADQALAQRLGVLDRILFLGAYPVDRISEVYAASDVFVLASRFDGWGAVLNEAASLGLPLIATDLCGGAWHVIDEGRNGHRVRAGSIASLGTAMKRYIEAPERLKEQGERSRSRFIETFTPEKNAQRLVEVLQRWYPI